MTIYFFDSSAIGKRYMTEDGSSWVRSLVAPNAEHVIILSRLAIVEISSALARKQRFGQIAPADALQRRTDFLLHVEKLYLTVPLDEAVLQRANDLIGKYPLRSLDALQLACAVEATTTLGEPNIFVCSDNNLLAAAAAEGFATDNPLDHP
ncbi:MAG: type II toxin-antitoxin system VapC family toxin [Chloroflexota bacterium]